MQSILNRRFEFTLTTVLTVFGCAVFASAQEGGHDNSGTETAPRQTGGDTNIDRHSPRDISDSGSNNELDVLSDIAWDLLSDIAVKLLSGNTAELLSGNEAELLSGNKPELLSRNETGLLSGNETNLLSGNETAFMSGNEAELLSGNSINLFSDINIKIHITNSGNNSNGEEVEHNEVRSAAFDVLDRDDDGRLTYDEFARGRNDIGVRKRHRRFKRLDIDGNHVLTSREFTSKWKTRKAIGRRLVSRTRHVRRRSGELNQSR